MTHPEWVFWIGTGIVCLAATSAWVFVFYYARYTRFEETSVGLHQMATMTMFAVVLTYTSVRSFQIGFDTLSAQPNYIRVLIYSAVTYVILGWLFLLVREQRKARQD